MYGGISDGEARKMSDDALLDAFEAASSNNNEFDNRANVATLRKELARRLRGRKRP